MEIINYHVRVKMKEIGGAMDWLLLLLLGYMADKHDVEGSTSSNVIDEGSDSTVELNVKTLNSQNYPFTVYKNMTVLAFKEKIASQIGLPVEQQRLIFRGKVLKDNDLLSDYHVESGHTLHLVERQPSQSQPTSGATSGLTNTIDGSRDSGQEPGVGGPRNRIGQISHSVMLGTLNVGDQGEGAVPDISRVIGAVLNSIGLGSQIGGGMPGMQFGGPVTTPQGNESQGSRNSTGAQGEAGNQSFNGPTFVGPTTTQAFQIPVGAAIAIPTLNTPISNSLTTLSEFMNHMERAFAQNANQTPEDTRELPRVELPANSNGGATLEGLSIILRQAERLIDGHAVAALSHIAGRLEQEAGSTDISARGQIQAETGRLGLEMQHLGALFLELGRTILTTRLGQSLAESSVNSGPPVYISPTGPNPIMVQPFPLQTGSLFGGSTSAPSNSAMFGPNASGIIPRNVNIHIHAVGMRGANGEGSLGDRNNGSGDSGQTRAVPMRNFTTTSTPSQPTSISISSHLGAPASQPPASSLSSAFSELNSQLRHLVDTMPTELRPPQDQSDISSVDGRSAGIGTNETTPGDGSNAAGAKIGQKARDPELRPCGTDNAEFNINVKEPSGSSAELSKNLTDSSEFSADGASQSSQGDHQGSSATPLGLGLGGLHPKRRSRQSKVQGKSGEASTQEQSRAVGQQVLQSLASFGNRQSTENVPGGGSLPNSTSVGCIPAGTHNTDGQLDIADTMSQILQNPALDGLLAGVSQQTGIGSPDALRNMMGQLTQNPAMRNTVSQIAQQIDCHDLGSMFSGQGGGFDLSRMMQQMMPIVSQALGGASSFGQTTPSVETQRAQSRPMRDIPPPSTTTQVDLQQLTRRIEGRSPPQEIFRSLIENAVNLNGVSNQETPLNELCSEDGLVNEFMHMLREDVSRRFDR